VRETVPLVSVVVTVRNDKKNLANLLEDILGLDWPHDRLELVVVDAYSTDGTWELLQEFTRKAPFPVTTAQKEGTIAAGSGSCSGNGASFGTGTASDVVYVGGGNTANMLAIWRLHGVDEALREAWSRGFVLCGTSAGANCWFEACTTDSFGPLAPLEDGLGLLAGSFCPHYDAEPERRPTYLRIVADGFPAGYAADDGVALHFRGTELREAVAASAIGRAFRVGAGGEEALAVRALG
jgi:glycosyltransferase involved in cell wall biosynthesis